MATTVTVRSGEELAELKTRSQDARVIGGIVARTIESQAQRAFVDQRLGDIEWPERYPSMDDPFVNIAALVNWTSNGGGVLSRFFDRRPALMGEGTLAGSISGRVRGEFVEVGSTLPYAGTHLRGGTTSQPVTDSTKSTVGKWMGMEKKDGKWRPKKNKGSNQQKNFDTYFLRIGWLLGASEIDTEVNARPFLGITPENEREMAEGIEEWVARGEG